MSLTASPTKRFNPAANTTVHVVDTFNFSVGDLISTPRRMFSKEGRPQNKQGGVGRILSINIENRTCNVGYTLGGSEKNVEWEYVSQYDNEKSETKVRLQI